MTTRRDVRRGDVVRRGKRDDPARMAQRAERREQLLDAATVVARRDGQSASMDAIAAEAGISKPILYRHFGDRDGLVQALTERFADGLMAELGAALALPGAPPDVLRGVIDAYVAIVERDPDVYRFLTRAGAPEQLLGLLHRIGAQVAVVLGERLREAGVDSGAAEPWAHGMVGMVHQAGDWWVERRSMPRARLVEYLTTLLWGGLSGAGVPDDLTLEDLTPDDPRPNDLTPQDMTTEHTEPIR